MALRADWVNAQSFPFIGLVTGDRVHLRAGPGLSYEILLVLPKRYPLKVWFRWGEWYAVEVPSQASGYVRRDDVALEAGWAVARTNRVHVRASPHPSSTSLGTIEAEERVRVRQILEDWLQVQVPSSCRAWVHSDYVTFMQPALDQSNE